jgi:anti-anti-sigma regulatory factor
MGSSKSLMSHDPLAGHEAAPNDAAESPANVSPTEVLLPSSLTIAEVGDIKRQFMTGLENARSLRIDCAALDVIDGAGLQLMAAVARTAAERQVELYWQSPPAMLEDNLALIGLGGFVTLAPPAPGA